MYGGGGHRGQLYLIFGHKPKTALKKLNLKKKKKERKEKALGWTHLGSYLNSATYWPSNLK